jgi:hypothetical protein
MSTTEVKPSLHRPPILAWGVVMLLAACAMLLSAAGAQAAAHRGAVLVKDINPGHSPSVTAIYCGDCNPLITGAS